jgi:hypothetical protein
MLTEEADVNALYDEAISNLRNRKPLDSPAVSAAEQDRRAKEYYANVRTNVGTLFLGLFNMLTDFCLGSGGLGVDECRSFFLSFSPSSSHIIRAYYLL